MIAARTAAAAGEEQRVTAYRRAAMEIAGESVGFDPLGAATTLFYAIEAEGWITGLPVDAVAAGDPAASEALTEISRGGYRTERMRGWLHRNWELVSERAESILLVNAIGGGR